MGCCCFKNAKRKLALWVIAFYVLPDNQMIMILIVIDIVMLLVILNCYCSTSSKTSSKIFNPLVKTSSEINSGLKILIQLP